MYLSRRNITANSQSVNKKTIASGYSSKAEDDVPKRDAVSQVANQ
jgi:hypothetical protein